MNHRTSSLSSALVSVLFVAVVAQAALASGCATGDGYGEAPAPQQGDRSSATAPTCTSGKSSTELFTKGPLYPTAVCIGVDLPECAMNDGTSVVTCNGDKGVCLDTGTNQLCLPACSFDDSGSAPTGCTGRDVCNVYGWGHDASGTVTGVGYCFGGCRSDGDCPKGSACQVEDGLCMNAKATYTKPVGTACTKTADASTCNCLYGATSGTGYCSSFCVVGNTACAAGFVCSPQLPTSDSSGALFSKDPRGIAGSCLKKCSSNADCSGMNATCTTTATGKVCAPS